MQIVSVTFRLVVHSYYVFIMYADDSHDKQQQLSSVRCGELGILSSRNDCPKKSYVNEEERKKGCWLPHF